MGPDGMEWRVDARPRSTGPDATRKRCTWGCSAQLSDYSTLPSLTGRQVHGPTGEGLTGFRGWLRDHDLPVTRDSPWEPWGRCGVPIWADDGSA